LPSDIKYRGVEVDEVRTGRVRGGGRVVEGGFKGSGGLKVDEGERAYEDIGIGVEGGACWEESGRERTICRSNGWFLGDCSRQLAARVARNRMFWLIELALYVGLSFCVRFGACKKL